MGLSISFCDGNNSGNLDIAAGGRIMHACAEGIIHADFPPMCVLLSSDNVVLQGGTRGLAVYHLASYVYVHPSFSYICLHKVIKKPCVTSCSRVVEYRNLLAGVPHDT